jgi:hypothetical protein
MQLTLATLLVASAVGLAAANSAPVALPAPDYLARRQVDTKYLRHFGNRARLVPRASPLPVSYVLLSKYV